MNGRIKKLNLTRNIKCSDCNASGLKSGASQRECSQCNGTGMVTVTRRMGPMISQQSFPCSKCSGKGKWVEPRDAFIKCRGNKFVSNKECIEIPIEKGTSSDEYIVLRGKGDE